MSTPLRKWQRLAAAARQLPANPEAPAAPHGFAMRVAARGLAAGRAPAWSLERMAWRALGVACLMAAVAVAVNFSFPAAQAPIEELFFMTDDPAAILLALS